MALRMVSRFYVTYADAVQAVADLGAVGIPDADISLIESEDDARLPADVAKDAAQPPGDHRGITGAPALAVALAPWLAWAPSISPSSNRSRPWAGWCRP